MLHETLQKPKFGASYPLSKRVEDATEQHHRQAFLLLCCRSQSSPASTTIVTTASFIVVNEHLQRKCQLWANKSRRALSVWNLLINAVTYLRNLQWLNVKRVNMHIFVTALLSRLTVSQSFNLSSLKTAVIELSFQAKQSRIPMLTIPSFTSFISVSFFTLRLKFFFSNISFIAHYTSVYYCNVAVTYIKNK